MQKCNILLLRCCYVNRFVMQFGYKLLLVKAA